MLITTQFTIRNNLIAEFLEYLPVCVAIYRIVGSSAVAPATRTATCCSTLQHTLQHTPAPIDSVTMRVHIAMGWLRFAGSLQL